MRRQAVWLVYQEFQADTPDVVGLFRSRQDAEEAAEVCRRWAREEYEWVVYGDEYEDGHEIAAWDVDVHVEEHEVEPDGGPRGCRSRREATWPRYNHLYVIAFSLDSDDPEGGDPEEIMGALRRRVDELEETGLILEAVGVPDETIDSETGLDLREE